VLAFQGQAYQPLDAGSMSDKQLAWTQSHLRILCGQYGVLRALDEIRPYRLEMGSKLAVDGHKGASASPPSPAPPLTNEAPSRTDLYQYWGSTITDALNEELAALPESQRLVVNCASQARLSAPSCQPERDSPGPSARRSTSRACAPRS
jgi:hypothetical protein